ncbi:hypothetical protein C6A77_13045 [Pseudomonas sp. AFG_SD02_1510_Pfu_092]|nr:hypothetical protein C6A77_13045 [Pseudomonas sp. AFG_SD02_1510_Pfu_092]
MLSGAAHRFLNCAYLLAQLLAQMPKAGAIPVGAAMAANTGAAGAMHRAAFFAGLPAPTGGVQVLRVARWR